MLLLLPILVSKFVAMVTCNGGWSALYNSATVVMISHFGHDVELSPDEICYNLQDNKYI